MVTATPNKQHDSEFETNAMPAPRAESPCSSPLDAGLPQQSAQQLNENNYIKHINIVKFRSLTSRCNNGDTPEETAEQTAATLRASQGGQTLTTAVGQQARATGKHKQVRHITTATPDERNNDIHTRNALPARRAHASRASMFQPIERGLAPESGSAPRSK
jgi:hypothetical protein